MEGFDCYESAKKCNPKSPKYKLPIVAYPHDETGGCAVVGKNKKKRYVITVTMLLTRSIVV